MGIKTGSISATSLIDNYIGTAYDNILFVRNNIDLIEAASVNIPLIEGLVEQAGELAEEIQGYASSASASATDASNSKTIVINLASQVTLDKNDTLGYKDAAELSATNASLAETNAKLSETNAASYEASTLGYRDESATSALTATTKASEAVISADLASSKADIAVSSATSATTSAFNAANSESLVLSYKDTAEAQATIATTKAAEAAASETAAKESETNAKSSETISLNQGNIATSKAAEALISANNASVSESNAEISATTAVNNANVSQTNADLTTVNLNLTRDAKDISLANSNYAGNWSDQTGAKSIPFAVRHKPSGEADQIWMLHVNAPDVTLTEPSINNSDWLAIGVIGSTAPDSAALGGETAIEWQAKIDTLNTNLSLELDTVESNLNSEISARTQADIIINNRLDEIEALALAGL